MIFEFLSLLQFAIDLLSNKQSIFGQTTAFIKASKFPHVPLKFETHFHTTQPQAFITQTRLLEFAGGISHCPRTCCFLPWNCYSKFSVQCFHLLDQVPQTSFLCLYTLLGRTLPRLKASLQSLSSQSLVYRPWETIHIYSKHSSIQLELLSSWVRFGQPVL